MSRPKGVIDPRWREFEGLHSLLYINGTNAAARIKGDLATVEHPLGKGEGPECMRTFSCRQEMPGESLEKKKAWCESALRQAGHLFLGEDAS